MHSPIGRQSTANQTIEPENAADIAVPETQLSIIRSTNVITVHDRLEITSGAATRSTSRPPLGRDHQEPARSAVVRSDAIALPPVRCLKEPAPQGQ